ncbi:unnamed protein product [Mytilus edulis]|uniref:SRCR domain-containing protein n=1 Tax=Mytilus edulis TaxID=6550 RepID=A0A8S3SNY7_MYTED|nr:unnamed protein product [Mytilus edulis]
MEEKTICLRYTLARHSIPTALAYKILGTAINAWPLKYEFQKPCLYHKASVLSVSEDNELRIWIEDNRVMVCMVNQNSLLSISPDIAASVQECLTRNIESSLLFHCKSFGRKITPTKVVDLYTIEAGMPCGSNICFIPSKDVLQIDSWKCDQGREHDTRYLRYWVFDKTQKMCVPGCEGEIRLVGAPVSGRLEIFHNKRGEPYDDGFGYNDAVKRQLGSSSWTNVQFYTSGDRMGQIWLDDLTCQELRGETAISSCSNKGWAKHNCGHTEDVGVWCLTHLKVICASLEETVPEMALEVYYNYQWGTVCNDLFDAVDARVACRQLDIEKIGNWGEWSFGNILPTSCGNGYQQRRRRCNSPIPSAGVQDVMVECKDRTRICNTPQPSNGGLYCNGINADSCPCTMLIVKSCYIDDLLVTITVHGQWGHWQGRSLVLHGNGIINRSRNCDSPSNVWWI